MFGKKLILIILAFMLVFSIVPNTATASDNPKLIKKVYLHADGVNPLETKTVSRVNKGEIFNLYFAVDDPNEGEYISGALNELPSELAKDIQDKIDKAAVSAEANTYDDAAENADERGLSGQEREDYINDYVAKNLQINIAIAKLRAEQVARHTEPHYDLNGFSVKIYFDSEYFEYAPPSDKSYEGIIDYTVPNGMILGSTEDEDVGVLVPDVFNSVGYQVRVFSDTIKTDPQSGLSYAQVHVYYSGTFLENEKDPDRWYNLCAIPLKAKKTGNSRVHIGTGSDYGVKLYAKHSDADDFQPLFDQSAENGGYHTIEIVDQSNPLPPVADPMSGSYTTAREIILTSPTEECDIYYSVNGGSFGLYTGPFTISQSSEIVAYTQKKKDENAKSSHATFNYRIIPQKPLLYKGDNDEKALITDPYYLYEPFTVYADNKYPYDNKSFDNATYLYYTYSDIHAEDFNGGGNNPDEDWVQLNKQMGQSIDINRTGKVRLIAVRETASGSEISEVAVYHLGIMPAPVKATPVAGSHTGPVEVSLISQNDEAEIYFTLDGTDPRQNGICYFPGAIKLDSSMTVRAVAKKDGVFSEVKDFYYEISASDEDTIYAVSPSGKYIGSTTVSLVSDKGNKIEYSTDGGNNWDVFEDTITVSDDTQILARTSEDGNVYTFTYEIVPAAPVFTPGETTFTKPGKVTVWSSETTAANTDDYTLFYTLDGTDPRTNGKTAPEITDTVKVNVSDKTEIKAVIKKGDKWSEVVSNTYEVFPHRPPSPDVTLTPGVYETSTDGEGFSTKFTAVNNKDVKIYYTVTYGDVPTPDPVPGEDGTYPYDPDSDEVELKGRTVINAIAVDTSNNTVSEVAVFEYVVVPFTPFAQVKSGEFDPGNTLVPVTIPDGSDFTYIINGNSITVENAPSEAFVDLKTGNIYEKDANGNLVLLTDDEINQDNSGDITFEIHCELDGQKSGTNTYLYKTDSADLSKPFADLESGTYFEEKRDGNLFHRITLLSSNASGTVIEYKVNNGEWQKYDDTAKIPLENVDTVLYARAKYGNDYSEVAEYVYKFVPPAPIIEPVSGTYPTGKKVTVSLPGNLPTLPDGKTYQLFLRTDESGDIRIPDGVTYTLNDNAYYRAYVINNFSSKKSDNTFRYYTVDDGISGGRIYTLEPYDVLPGNVKLISKDALSEEPYNEGIHLRTKEPNTFIKYSYVVTKNGKETNPTDYVTYDDSNPIVVSSAMDKIEITAKLIDFSGEEIVGSECVFTYEFIELEVPKTDLYLKEPTKIEYPKTTTYTFVNDYEGKSAVMLFYTTDSSNKKPDKDNAELYVWDTLLGISKDLTVRAVYYMACQSSKCEYCKAGDYANCENGIYSSVGKYSYTVKTAGAVSSGSGGGGGRVIDNTRRYTKDIFGNEHPTHISYINGYPDGSVKPAGNITREEIAAILYRITNHEYESPFVVTGNVFPDVSSDRWSVLNIEYLAGKEVITGYPDGEYKPGENLTRAEFASLVARFASLKTKEKIYPFGDLAESHWAYDDIIALYKEGLINGYEDDSFRPDSKITRAEVMKVINLLLGRNPSEIYVKSLKLNPYNDLEESKWYYVDVIEATITHNYYLDSKDVEIKWEDIK